MPLQSPPDDLSEFPSRTTPLGTLYRIFWHRDPHTGDVNSPWRFSSVPPGLRRFDLRQPSGTCYWSDLRYGAFLEVFRNCAVVADADVKNRRLWVGNATELALADLLAPHTAALGITAAISTQPDYEKPQEWAAALAGLGFDGLVGTCSHDPTSAALNVAVFGVAGTPDEQPGWSVAAKLVGDDAELSTELVAFGIRIARVPYDVTVVVPPV